VVGCCVIDGAAAAADDDGDDNDYDTPVDSIIGNLFTS